MTRTAVCDLFCRDSVESFFQRIMNALKIDISKNKELGK
jgi:hypothetical protein